MCLRIRLDLQEDVIMRSQDGKPLQHRCNKLLDGAPALDLVPRARYLLRVDPMPLRTFACRAAVLLEHGLLVEPWPEPDGEVRHVVALNLADRLFRAYDGQTWPSDAHAAADAPPDAAASSSPR